MYFEGEIAALVTAVLWAASAMLFTVSGKRVGAQVVNVTRLAIAAVLIGVTHFFLFGSPYPIETELWRFGVLALSAVVGLVIGDGALFYAFVLIGPRLSMLIMSLVPVLSAGFAWICFGETIANLEYYGIFLAVASVAWVVTEEKGKNDAGNQDDKQPGPVFVSKDQPDAQERIESAGTPQGKFQLGLIMAFIGALGQTGNLIITKYALTDQYSTLSATEIRIVVSLSFLIAWAAFKRELLSTFRRLRDLIALSQITLGALFGPFLGIWFSYIAIEKGRIGIAATIISISPVLLIPLSAIFLKERISRQAIFGTLLALAGIAILCLAPVLGTSK